MYSRHFLLIFVFSLVYISNAVAEEQCHSEFAGGKASGDVWQEIWLFDPQICAANRITTPHYRCGFVVGLQHGSANVSCGRDFDARWRTRPTTDQRSYFDTIGEGPKAKLPTQSQLRRHLAENNNTDASPDIYDDVFPARFLSAGSKTSVGASESHGVIQTFRYVIANGNTIDAVAGEKILGCRKFQFAVWPKPDKLEGSIRDMATFIADLRLEKVDQPAIETYLKRVSGFESKVCKN